MSINIKQIKENLILDDYEKILDELDIPITNQSGDVWSLKSMCHSISADDCDSNLAFYTNTQTFTCFSHNCIVGGDIFELIQTRQKLFNPDYTFLDSVNFVLDILGFDGDKFRTKSAPLQTTWQQIVAKYRRDNVIETEPTTYNDKILKSFPKLYYQGWIDEGINIDTMAKYEIAFYPTKNCIIIPCRDIDNNLIGIRGRYFNDDYGKYRPLRLLDDTKYNFPTSMFMYGEWQNKESIQRQHKVILVEGEKSVLKSDSWYGDNSITLALYGKNISGEKIKTLLSLGVDEVILGYDYDYHKLGDKESIEYKKTILKATEKLKPYFKVSVLFNDKFEGYQYSPFDFKKEQFEYLLKNRVVL